nr:MULTISPECIES: phospho-sugar glycosidase domain-containing protein [Lactobacillus]
MNLRERSIYTKDLTVSEPRMNKVGSISSDELFLLDFIKPWSKFKLTSK